MKGVYKFHRKWEGSGYATGCKWTQLKNINAPKLLYNESSEQSNEEIKTGIWCVNDRYVLVVINYCESHHATDAHDNTHDNYRNNPSEDF